MWLDADATDRLLGIMLEADVLESHDPVRLDERSRWVRASALTTVCRAAHWNCDRRPHQPCTVILPRVSRMPTGRQYSSRPLVAMLEAVSDSPADWLRAGRALQRGLLTASSLDVAASFAAQPLEHPEPRRYIRELVARSGHPQMVIQLGYSRRTTGRAPRRHWRRSSSHDDACSDSGRRSGVAGDRCGHSTANVQGVTWPRPSAWCWPAWRGTLRQRG